MRELLAQAVALAELGIYEHDHLTETIWVSPGFRAIYGWSADHPTTLQDLLACVHPDDAARVRDAVARAHDPQGDGLFDAEGRLIRADGEVRWIRSRSQTFFVGEGARRRPSRTIGVSVDRTERRRLEEQLRQAQKMEAVGRLAGGIAHDFNNVLLVILGYLDLHVDALAPGALRADLEEIRSAAQRATGLTRQLLAFSRQQSISARPTDPARVIERVETMLHRILGADIELRCMLHEPSAHVLVDPTQFEQIIMNLAVNARDAMPRGGSLTIETMRVEASHPRSIPPRTGGAGPFVLITVTDTGEGMDEATRQRIFEPFFTTKGPGRGTGLGLATVYGIVQQSGGSISVRSEPGRGTTFELLLPVTREAEREEAPPPPPPVVRTGARVLIVDDDAAIRRLVRTVLQQAGYAVLDAADPQAALALAAQHPDVDLLLTDVIMPKVRGDELAAKIAALHPHVRVLFISGYTGDGPFVNGAIERPESMLEKPFTPRALLDAISAALA
ncbi:ATP-binding protein [Myxococcota bacterium]|nr:ATP-binding protein [Myxococcota bacterium]